MTDWRDSNMMRELLQSGRVHVANERLVVAAVRGARMEGLHVNVIPHPKYHSFIVKLSGLELPKLVEGEPATEVAGWIIYREGRSVDFVDADTHDRGDAEKIAKLTDGDIEAVGRIESTSIEVV